MNNWSAEITNDPNNNFELYIEILHQDKFIGRIYKNELRELQLMIYEGIEIVIPANWLAELFISAEKDL